MKSGGKDVDPERPRASPPSASVEYTSLLSHVLMTPLSGIVLWCDMLRGKPGLSELVERGLNAIDHSARAQVAILDNMVELSRMQAGGTELHRVPVDVEMWVADVLVRAASAARHRQIELRFEPPLGIPPLHGDPIRLRTALNNVIENAVNASSAGGHVDIGVEETPRGIAIHVTDGGGGIAPDVLQGLFTVAPWTETTLAQHRGGLGLGLPVARWIVELHGGTIEVAPNAPSGTRVTLVVPPS